VPLVLGARMRALQASGRKAFIPYLTAGYPDLETFATLLGHTQVADCVEIGLPYSDPVADGPSICHASDVALAAGMHADALFDLLAGQRDLPPLVLMTYLNPVLAYGVEAFMVRAAAAGVHGLLVTDLPPEEGEPVFAAAAAQGIASVLLVSPTTKEARLRALTTQATGFLYAVAVTGTTGARDVLGSQAEPLVRRVRAATDLPVVVGFGLSTPEQVQQVCRFADGAVVGSALVDVVRSQRDRGAASRAFAARLESLAAAAHAAAP
jgi:tryptophan synthase alpha chain